MRGQRPTLAVLLAWLTLLALVLTSVATVHSQTDTTGLSATSLLPAEDRGGEGNPPEPAPAKLRRAPAPPVRDEAAALELPSLWVSERWLDLLPLTLIAEPVTSAWPPASADTAVAERPGRRVQRGQAPPQA